MKRWLADDQGMIEISQACHQHTYQAGSVSAFGGAGGLGGLARVLSREMVAHEKAVLANR